MFRNTSEKTTVEGSKIFNGLGKRCLLQSNTYLDFVVCLLKVCNFFICFGPH